LLDNKIRADMLDNAYRVTLYRAANPDKKLLEIGIEAGVSPATFNANTKEWDLERQRDLESMTSRLLRKAYRLSENAARGKFPSLDPVFGGNTTFDWKVLGQQYHEYLSKSDLYVRI